jgi:glyoxylase-like metal-dependent hydrolase (beta-lactamase superfamily II)
LLCASAAANRRKGYRNEGTRVGRSARSSRLRENVSVWTLGGDRIESSYGANCTAVIGREAVLLVDPLIAPAHARLVENALREMTSLPVRFVVLTHHHTDHALGASWFGVRGATVVAHRACQEAMAAVAQARTSDPARMQSRLRSRFPGYLLEEVVGS